MVQLSTGPRKENNGFDRKSPHVYAVVLTAWLCYHVFKYHRHGQQRRQE
jgi:hypothetical protein